MRLYPAVSIRAPHPSPEFGELVPAIVEDFGPIALEETEGGMTVRVFFPDEASRNASLGTLREAFPDAVIEPLDVSDEDWAARSQASLRAVQIGSLIVAPPWDRPSDAERVIVINPSTGFGTGHHATTRLCLMVLQEVISTGGSVIDVGTGSGVLALAAAKLGASRVVGIDNDPDAISNARENRVLNGLNVDFRCEPLEKTTATGAEFDLLMANLTGGVLIKNARLLEGLTRCPGRLIVSGLREEEEALVVKAFSAEVVSRRSEDGWVCLVLAARPKGLRHLFPTPPSAPPAPPARRARR